MDLLVMIDTRETSQCQAEVGRKRRTREEIKSETNESIGMILCMLRFNSFDNVVIV